MEAKHVINGISEVLPEMWIFLAPIIVLQLIMMVTALIGIAKKDVPFIEKAIWIPVVICISIIGPVVYFVVGSRMIDEKTNKER